MTPEAAQVSSEDTLRAVRDPAPGAEQGLLQGGKSEGTLASPFGKWLLLVGLLAVAALVVATLAWQRLQAVQIQLARQSADATGDATLARATAKQAQELALETAAKLAVTDAKVSEVSLQRTQLEELMQSLARSRDENMVVDIESALRLAQQQAQLTGSLEPLLAALRSAEARVSRAAQPRLARLQRALAHDAGRVNATALADMPTLLAKLDELVRLADDLPLANALASNRQSVSDTPEPGATEAPWWAGVFRAVWGEVKGLVRVSRIDNPEAVLVAPEQAFFLRENLKLTFLNARLGLLSRQHDAARADLRHALQTIAKYFDGNARKTQAARAMLSEMQLQMQSLDIPRIDESLAALATAAAGR